MKLLVDMNLSPKWADFLVSNGFEAQHWSMIGAANASDPELMAFALANDHVILTHDLDFGAILAASGGRAPSVVQIRSADLAIGSIGPQVAATLRQAAVLLKTGALVTVDPVRARITLLPIRS